MVAKMSHHIKLVGDNPLDAVLDGRSTKAYLVANLAFLDGVQTAVEHYDINPATVYAAMSFYEENRSAIEEAIKKERLMGYANGAINGQEAIEAFKRRMKED